MLFMDLNELLSLLSGFLTDIETIDFAGCEIIVSDNIYHDIEIIDSEYAHERINNPIYGLLYPTLDNKLIIYVDKKQNNINLIATLLHEITHYSDYSALASSRKQPFRVLFDDYYFLLWSEFHASYISNRVMLMLGRANIDCQQVACELCEKHNNFIAKKKQIELSEYANFCFRLYGDIIALSDEFPDEQVFGLTCNAINERFFAIFDYLCNHKTLDDVLSSFDGLTALIEAADN